MMGHAMKSPGLQIEYHFAKFRKKGRYNKMKGMKISTIISFFLFASQLNEDANQHGHCKTMGNYCVLCLT